ncbi:MAG TPA: 50S ribosomal protein L3 N(5)-glutamine methyltransferase [Usitatibacter sp.]|nr:50S ribosomal protein L3 N(5)-glutamine methyltransferase [Usitatibacter sp.]
MKVRVGEAVQDSAERLDAAGVAFGHGTTDAGQEALWLAAHVLGLDWHALVGALDDPMPAPAAAALRKLTERRISTRKPAAYLLNEAWLGPHRFYVDERVIVPRSFIFELLETGDRPLGPLLGNGKQTKWSVPGSVLDLCTGSGCLAILAALAWPQARVDAADISPEALEVARRNVDDYRLAERVSLVRSDLFAGLAGRTYDLIVSNPPYVKAASMKKLPEEYRREPALALASGADGLDHVRVILRKARAHLNRGGLLVVEVGHNRKALEKAFPDLPFEWPRTSGGRNFVFTLPREALPR